MEAHGCEGGTCRRGPTQPYNFDGTHGGYRSELGTLMIENFHIVAKEEIPVEYREVA